MARLATGLPATALAGLDLHQLDSNKEFHCLITDPPFPRLSQRDPLLADSGPWNPRPTDFRAGARYREGLSGSKRPGPGPLVSYGNVSYAHYGYTALSIRVVQK